MKSVYNSLFIPIPSGLRVQGRIAGAKRRGTPLRPTPQERLSASEGLREGGLRPSGWALEASPCVR